MNKTLFVKRFIHRVMAIEYFFIKEMIKKARSKTTLCRGGYDPPDRFINQNDCKINLDD